MIVGSQIPSRPLPFMGAISVASPESIGDVLITTGVANAATAAWPAANRALFMPFEIDMPRIATTMAWYNGSAAAGNIDVGIYDLTGARLVSSGATAQTGTTVAQTVDITDTLLVPGVYYMAMARDGTNSVVAWSSSLATQLLQVFGVQEMASAYVLPSSVTYANPSSAYVPMMAVGFRGVM